MTTALILFALAAVGGIVLAAQRFSGKPHPSLALALIHGTAAACGLVALIAFIAKGGVADATKVGLGLILLAALGGFFLFSMHLRNKALPIPVMLGHALVAVAGFLTLLISALH